MRTRRTVFAATIALAVVALGCTESPVAVETIDSPALAVVTISATSVTALPGGAPIAGASATLTQAGNGVAVRLNTNGLTAGDAYSLWAFSGGPLLVTGHVVGGSGQTTFTGRIGSVPIASVTHLILRHNGPNLPGNAQFLGPNGGCPPNTCTSVQRADF